MSRRVRAWLADPVAAGAVAGAVVGVVEVARLGGGALSLWASVLGVCVGAGALIGGVLGGALAVAALVERAIGARAPSMVRAIAGALVLAAASLIVLVPVGRTMFQGAYAATLPGAGIAPWAVPLAGWLAVAAAIVLGRRWLGDGRGWRRGSLALVLAAGGAALAVANRVLFRTGYPELHLGVTLATLAILAIAVRIAAGGAPLAWRARGALAGAALALVAITAVAGLSSAADRQAIATRADDARHLVRVARTLADVDGDGVAAILGGGDCDEGDARRHAGARDVPGNHVDEDCDGVDAVARAAPDPVAAQTLADWRAQPAVQAALARTRELDVVIISIDALRADQLPPAAADRAAFPHLSALLDRSRWFLRGFAPAAGTDVSLSTLVTGRWNPFQPIDTTLFEALAAAGRATHAVLPREVLRYAGETLLTRGLGSFDRVVTDGAHRDVGDRISARATTDRALAFLDQVGDRRFALWVHYFDIHEHAQLPIPAELLAAVPADGRGPVARRYRALLKVIDGQVGRLLDELAARGRAERTIIVLCSDHGESLGDDPRLPERHGLVVYQALIHVPIAIHVPGWPAGVELEPVSLVDLAPTLAALTGAAMPAQDGIDLTPELYGATGLCTAGARALVAHEQDQWAVVAWPWKLLVRPADNLTELYRIDEDPGERDDRAAAEPARVMELRARYGEFPAVPMDRTVAGRRWRDQQARKP
jgi:arylsulfatase A-like enzyme